MKAEQLYEDIMRQQDKELRKHPDLSLNGAAYINGMIEQAKKEGAREFLEYVKSHLIENGGNVGRWEIRFEDLEEWLKEMEMKNLL